MIGGIARCPRCRPPVVRRADGSRITGFLPEALYVGYLRVNRRWFKTGKVPAACPNCGAALIDAAREGLARGGTVRVDE